MNTAQALVNNVSRNNLLREHLELPPLPIAAQRLLAMIENEDVEIEALAEVIELDPAMTARIIGLSRSAFFGDGSNIHSVKDAIVRVLGLNLVRSLALSMSLSGVFRNSQVPSFSLQRYWCNALLTGSLARQLVPHLAVCREIEPDQAYLAGLLHSVGYLPMVHSFPEQMESVFQTGAGAPEWTLPFVQRQLLGVDHHDAGVWLGMRWSLPAETVVVMKYHNDPLYQGQHWEIARLILYCTRLVQWRLRNPKEHIKLTDIPTELQPRYEKFGALADRFEQQFDVAVTMATILSGPA